MAGTAVAYSTRHGSTQRYAAWLAQDLDADLLEAGSLSQERLAGHDTLVVLSPVYAGRIADAAALKDPSGPLGGRRVALVVVGMTPPDSPERAEIVANNLPEATLEQISVFHLRGAIDYQALSRLERVLMRFANWRLRSQARRHPTPETTAAAAQAGVSADRVDRAALAPVLAWARGEGG
ncbi:flavodoxin domain-containing protein [Actinomycetota bacterium]